VGQAFAWTVYVTNGIIQEGVLSPYLFSVYLDEKSLELNNIKAECYSGEVLLNLLMFADNICVFRPSVRGLQSILDVCQACQTWHSATKHQVAGLFISQFRWNFVCLHVFRKNYMMPFFCKWPLPELNKQSCCWKIFLWLTFLPDTATQRQVIDFFHHHHLAEILFTSMC